MVTVHVQYIEEFTANEVTLSARRLKLKFLMCMQSTILILVQVDNECIMQNVHIVGILTYAEGLDKACLRDDKVKHSNSPDSTIQINTTKIGRNFQDLKRYMTELIDPSLGKGL